MTKIRQKRELIRKLDDGRLIPVERELDPIDLDTGFLNDDSQHRWLLTTCIAGVAGTILVGGLLLGLFGRNASPVPANAATQKHGSFWGTTSPTADKQVVAERDLNGGYSYPQIKQDDLPYSKENTKVLDADIQQVFDTGNNITTITKTPPPEPVDESFTIGDNSTLASELASRGVPQAAADAVVAAIDPIFPSKDIKAGTRIDVTFDRQIDFYGREVTFPVVLSFDQAGKGTISVNVDEDGQFTAEIDNPNQPKVADSNVTQFHTIGQVGASLSASAQDQKIPDYIVSEFIHVFSYDVDFQRQVEASDTFEVFYGNPLSGSSSKRKVLHMARLTLNGQTRTFYRFTTADGLTDYFDENGHSAASKLIRTPVNGAHLTSGFGVRIHPLLGYSKMHTGVDFGAPTGTAIHAAGDGDIEQVGRERGYGNTIIIEHNDHLETLYAHMTRFAAGIREGVHVNQGQVIGYVGATGDATGPHLHFEVRIDDRPVNPNVVRSTGGRQLAGKDFANFKANRDQVLAMMKQAPSATSVADANNQ